MNGPITGWRWKMFVATSLVHVLKEANVLKNPRSRGMKNAKSQKIMGDAA